MAKDIRTLEDAVAATLAERYGSDRPAEVRMRFDPAGIPHWLRQYQAHYFNYVLKLDAVEANT